MAADRPTTMNLTFARKSAVSRAISLWAKGRGAATDEAPLPAFEGRQFQEDERVADVVGIGLGMGGEDLLHAGGEPARPTFGTGGGC